MAPPSRLVLAVGIAVAVAAVSTAATLIRLATATPLVIAFWRLAFATAILAPAAALSPGVRDEVMQLTARDAAGMAVVGAVLAIHFAAWIASLELTSVAASVVLVTAHPIFVGILSAWLFDEGLGSTGWAGVGLALAGAAVIALTDRTLAGHRLVGDLLAVVGALAVGVYFLAGRRWRKELSLLAYVVPVYAASAVTLGAWAAVAGDPLVGWPATDYVLFLALAVVPMILGHTILNWSLRYVTAPVVATTVLGEPVGAALIAWAVLAEVPPVGTIAGGAAVLVGIGIVAWRRG